MCFNCTTESKILESDCTDMANCTTGCNPGFFGPECNSTCSSGCLNNTCARGTGSCLDGCIDGHFGLYCEAESDGFTSDELAGAIGGAAVICAWGVIVIILICVIWRRRKKDYSVFKVNDRLNFVPSNSDVGLRPNGDHFQEGACEFTQLCQHTSSEIFQPSYNQYELGGPSEHSHSDSCLGGLCEHVNDPTDEEYIEHARCGSCNQCLCVHIADENRPGQFNCPFHQLTPVSENVTNGSICNGYRVVFDNGCDVCIVVDDCEGTPDTPNPNVPLITCDPPSEEIKEKSCVCEAGPT